MSRNRNQSGFSIVQVLLVIVVIALVGGVGYYVYDANNKATDTYDRATESSNQQVVQPKQSDSQSTSQSSTNDAETLQNAARGVNPNTPVDTQN